MSGETIMVRGVSPIEDEGRKILSPMPIKNPLLSSEVEVELVENSEINSSDNEDFRVE